jgi:hypothetical protein
LDSATRAAALRQRGERLERGPRAAKMIDQRAKGARPDILAANKSQPVDPLLIAQRLYYDLQVKLANLRTG